MYIIYFSLLFQAPSIDEKVDLHFIALVHVDGHLYELGKNYFNLSWGEKWPALFVVKGTVLTLFTEIARETVTIMYTPRFIKVMLALKMRELVEKTGTSELFGEEQWEGKSCSKTPWSQCSSRALVPITHMGLKRDCDSSSKGSDMTHSSGRCRHQACMWCTDI